MRNTQYLAAGLADADMVWLLSQGHLRKLHPGEALVEAGRALAEVFFVMRGTLSVMRADGALIARLGESDMVGEMSFIEQMPPSVGVRADGHAEVLAIGRARIAARLADEPAFAARFYRAIAVYLSARLRETTAAAGRGEIAVPEPQVCEARFRRLFRTLVGS